MTRPFQRGDQVHVRDDTRVWQVHSVQDGTALVWIPAEAERFVAVENLMLVENV